MALETSIALILSIEITLIRKYFVRTLFTDIAVSLFSNVFLLEELGVHLFRCILVLCFFCFTRVVIKCGIVKRIVDVLLHGAILMLIEREASMSDAAQNGARASFIFSYGLSFGFFFPG